MSDQVWSRLGHRSVKSMPVAGGRRTGLAPSQYVGGDCRTLLRDWLCRRRGSADGAVDTRSQQRQLTFDSVDLKATINSSNEVSNASRPAARRWGRVVTACTRRRVSYGTTISSERRYEARLSDSCALSARRVKGGSSIGKADRSDPCTQLWSAPESGCFA